MSEITQVITGKATNGVYYNGKLHSFTLRQGKTKDGVNYVSGFINLALNQNEVVRAEVFAMSVFGKGDAAKPNPTYLFLLDLIRNGITVDDRADEDAKIASLIADEQLKKQIVQHLAVSKRKSGYEDAWMLKTSGSFEMNCFVDKDDNEVVSTRKTASRVQMSDSETTSADFAAHTYVSNVIPGEDGKATVQGFTFDFRQKLAIPVSFKTEVEAHTDYMSANLGNIILLKGNERSLVIEKVEEAGGFGTVMTRKYDKGLFLTSGSEPIEYDEEAFSKAVEEYNLIKAEQLSRSRASRDAKKTSTPAAPTAAVKQPVMF